MPGNQLFHLVVDEEQIELTRLPPELAGISILHLSDFHFSGRVELAYFHEVVRIANELEPDLIAVTGDICDAAATIDWIEDIFGRLAAPLGKFFILGNHDLRTRDCSATAAGDDGGRLCRRRLGAGPPEAPRPRGSRGRQRAPLDSLARPAARAVRSAGRARPGLRAAEDPAVAHARPARLGARSAIST